jgi:hypothetical protein
VQLIRGKGKSYRLTNEGKLTGSLAVFRSRFLPDRREVSHLSSLRLRLAEVGSF